MRLKPQMRFANGMNWEDSFRLAAKASGTGVCDYIENSEITFFFPNYQDYGYGIFLLDDKSRDYVLKNIQNEKDPFLRSMMWGALWDSVREGELDPREYVELIVRTLSTTPAAKPATPPIQGGESDESTIALLLARVGTALNYYVSDKTRAELAPRVENILIDRMKTAETLGQRITYYRAFLNVASSEKAKNVLKAMLKKSEPPASAGGFRGGGNSAFPLKTKDKFDIVTRLLILGDPDAPRLLAELEKTETSDDAKRYAYAAKAGIATTENKAKFWNDFVNNKEISESWIEAAFGPWNSIRHSDLTLPYLQKALQELPNHKRNRKIFFVNGWLGAFIGGQRSEEALAIVNKFLADNPNLDNDLRLKILENVDLIERAVRIRGKYGN
jgi:aminopeptidase N